ncbi:MAG: hypothetical protein H6701_14420 [Myxococcales bacterium]|nr:hypothetical protein [Myxococcales bacterium]
MTPTPHRLARALHRATLVALATAVATACAPHDNHPPTFAPLADATFRVDVGGTLRVEATDPDDDRITYTVALDPVPPSAALGAPRLEAIGGGALFSWNPTAQDAPSADTPYRATFTATDEHGAAATTTVTLTVQPRRSTPDPLRFAAPDGDGLLLLGDCVDALPITVTGRPDDAVAITLEQPPAARCDGAKCNPVTLTPDGPGAHKTLSWCPTPAQLADAVHHPLRLDARALQGDDSVSKRYFLRFHRPAAPGCAGAPPVIRHTPPDPVEGPLDYVITAEIDDDLGIKTAPIVAYAFDPDTAPHSPRDLDGWSAVQLTRVDGTDRWQAAIPNLGLAPGDKATLHYALFATDNDDPTATRCDHAAEAGPFTLEVRGGDDATAYAPCAPCRSDRQCGGETDRCVPLFAGAFCARGCAEQADCAPGETCAEIQSLDGVTARQCVPVDGDCGQLCIADRYEGTDSREAAGAPLIEPGALTELSLCAEDIDRYRLAIDAGQSVLVRAAFDGRGGDLDLGLELPGPDAWQHQSLGGGGDAEAVYEPCAPHAGEATISVWAFDGQLPRYDLDVQVGPGECDVACAPDAYDTPANDSRGRATPVALPLQTGPLSICPGDRDFYRFDAAPGALIRVDLRLEAPRLTGDLGLRLWRGDDVIGESAAFRQAEAVEAVAALGGDYAVEVFGLTPRSVNRYTLLIEATAGLACGAGRDCPVGQTCVDGVCTDGRCESDRDCDPSQRCVTPRLGEAPQDVGGRCATRCRGDRDCRPGAGLTCTPLDDDAVCLLQGATPIGARCARHEECAPAAACLALPGGYCAPIGCDDCPEGTACARIAGVEACLKACDSGGDCRVAEGYGCALRDADAPVCQPVNE